MCTNSHKQTNMHRVWQLFTEEKRKGHEADDNDERANIITMLQASRDPKTGAKLTQDEILCEAQSMVVNGKLFMYSALCRLILLVADDPSGSLTVSTVLISLFYYLAQDSSVYDRLADEIRTTFPSLDSVRQGSLLTSCIYLRSCVDEAMRLIPPEPGAPWREVCPGGATIDGENIPEGIEVAVCPFAIHHNPEYFPNPYIFDPDRFMPKSSSKTEPTLSKPKFDFFPTSRANTKFPNSPSALSPNSFQGMYFPSSTSTKENPAFVPFLMGPTGCPGKSLAYLEISLAVAMVFWCFDFKFAEAERQSNGNLDGDAACKLQFRKRCNVDLG